MISKTFVGVMSYLIIMQAVSGLFWDFLGFGGLFTICAIKGNCKGPHKRDTDGVKKVQIPSICIQRLICQSSTGNKDSIEFENILKILPKEVEKIPPHLKKLSNQLRAAKKFGIQFKDVEACKTKFKCPLSNEEMKKMIGYEGNQDHDNNV